MKCGTTSLQDRNRNVTDAEPFADGCRVRTRDFTRQANARMRRSPYRTGRSHMSKLAHAAELECAKDRVVRGFTCDEPAREARTTHSSLLRAKGLRHLSVEIEFRFVPCAEVAGDFVDFFCLPNGMIDICLGDVLGRGCRQRCTPHLWWEHCAVFARVAQNGTSSCGETNAWCTGPSAAVSPPPWYALFNPAAR